MEGEHVTAVISRPRSVAVDESEKLPVKYGLAIGNNLGSVGHLFGAIGNFAKLQQQLV